MVFKHLIHVWNKTNRWFRVASVILVLQFGGLPQRQPGYHCNDPALSHPFTGDTVSWKLLLFLSFVAPLIFMFSVERYCRSCSSCTKEKEDESGTSTTKVLLQLYKEYTYGLLLNLALVQVLKVIVGAPRPHFFDVCSPDTTCEGSEFVSSYNCANSLYSYVRKADAGRSFPSGHTSLAVHTCLFITWYLQNKKELIKKNSPPHTVPVVQAVVVLCGLVCGLSRITDRRHHWWDVLAGAAIGVAIVIYTIRCLCRCTEYFDSTTRIFLETRPTSHNSEQAG